MKIAYFSMEIGLTENIPTYSGGLGILAGDHIKAAADLNIPLVAITLLYKRGYFIQNINPFGQQEELYPYFDPRAFMEPLPFKVKIRLDGRDVHIGVWKHNVIGMHDGNGHSRVPVYFLDTDLADNAPADRLITQYLYGGDQHTRISQEAVLGIGGYLAFKRLEPKITTYHMNEGHAVFLTLAMLKDFGGDVEQVKSRCVFTTHTPVPAGHDKFTYDLAEKMIGEYLPPNIKTLAGEDILNTTVLALHLSRAANGVSQLHGEISRLMFPGFNIGHITNGVHHASWTGPDFSQLYDKYIPTWRRNPQQLADISIIPDSEIVEAKKRAKKRLISYINSLSGAGFTDELLTICFARRAAAYKRATLIFSDLEFLFNLSYDRVQFVFAGKAHPQDALGKELIKQVVDIGKQYENQLKLVFVPNYNIWVASDDCRRRRLAQHAAPPKGGERHQRHEGLLQRRRQHERARRMVAGSLQGPCERVGHRRR